MTQFLSLWYSFNIKGKGTCETISQTPLPVSIPRRGVTRGHCRRIFLYNVEREIQVHTGEEGYDALQDAE